MKEIRIYCIKGTFTEYIPAESEEQAEELFYERIKNKIERIEVEEVYDEQKV